ncbi:MAG: glycosyltransferase family 39 protein [Anaerolineales bacterium]|nr:glycosyltransferase family 39 protein [Anaerolineales bacterium]
MDLKPNIETGKITKQYDVLVLVLLALVVAAGAFLRLRGLNWDEQTHIHPDERFLTMVETSIQLPDSIGEYFNTAASPLNPANAGHTFFVYGTFPIFLVRLFAENIQQIGYDEVHLLGRALAAVFDIVSILLLFLLGKKVTGKWVGLLAAAFYAFSVLPIQHSHFFVVDIFTNTFLIAGFYFAVKIQDQGKIRDYLLFGLMLGAASACKISSLPLAAWAMFAALLHFLDAKKEDKYAKLLQAAKGLAAAGLVSFLVFRILQPYAFEGPGFFNIIPNSNWIANIREISNQQSGDVDFPPALQWAYRTPVLFALKNMVLWGLGIPLALAGWGGWILAVVDAVRRKTTRFILLILWVILFFLWQSTNHTPAMRYQLPVYPFLALFAGWLFCTLWERTGQRSKPRVSRAFIAAAGFITIVITGLWAMAFSSIYVRTNTHVAASRWIYQNIPAGVNLQIESQGEESIEPLPISRNVIAAPGGVQSIDFLSDKTIFVDTVTLPSVTLISGDGQWPTILVSVYEEQELLGSGVWEPENADEFHSVSIPMDSVISLEKAQKYRLELQVEGQNAVRLESFIQLSQYGREEQLLEVEIPQVVSLVAGNPYRVNLPGGLNGNLESVNLPYVENLSYTAEDTEITIRASFYRNDTSIPVQQEEAGVFIQYKEEMQLILNLETPIPVEDIAYLELELVTGKLVQFRGSNLVSESSWDLGLPARIEGRDGYGGLYQSGNLEMYWPDNQNDDADAEPDKLERIVNDLEEGDYLIIATNRQYGTIPRTSVRYPLSDAFYRALFDCPTTQSVLACGAYLQPNGSVSDTGYELVAVFASHPAVGALQLNDQLAEEAFTVYDHPKVLIFRKTDAFNAEKLGAMLAEVDLRNIQNLPPAQLPRSVKTLLLPEGLLQLQRSGGTWSELFNRDAVINQSGFLAAAVWWLLIALLGWTMVPVLYYLMPGLRDRGYGFARTMGLVLLAWLAWMAGNMRIPVTRSTLLIIFGMMVVAAVTIILKSPEIRSSLSDRRKQILLAEAVALAAFLIFLAIRIGNPDLWHPAKGGEKPMNFAYLNAVLKSTYFPPYDPWFAGGTINYYYFGYVVVGMPLKLLGIVPSVGYNLIIPTLFSISALSAYSLVYSFVNSRNGSYRAAVRTGILAVFLFVVLGNLGNARLLYRGLVQMGGENAETSSIVKEIPSFVTGVWKLMSSDETIPVAMDRWYWDASRAFAAGEGEAGPITEFPLFTFLYADLHAHMINLPLTVLTLAWALSWLKSREKYHLREWRRLLPVFLLWGLSLGVIRPTNTWDYPLFWLLSVLAVAAAAWCQGYTKRIYFLLETLAGSTILLGIARISFALYDKWYLQGYTTIKVWTGSHTSLHDYLTVTGLFYFVLTSWLWWETRKWMEQTPITALSRLRPKVGLIAGTAVILVATVGVFAWMGITISVIVLPFLLWSLILFLFRKEFPSEKKAVILLAMAASAVTLMVEVIVLTGDISRMNTVFKFYFQAWTLLSISTAVAFFWVIQDWQRVQRLPFGKIFMVGTVLLMFGAAMYPLAAVPVKIQDRMASQAPKSMDGDAFMDYASYYEFDTYFEFREDYEAIQWLQANVSGSPVILEASIPEYRWGSRISIHTGLPSVLGWNWHQRQQRVNVGSEEVSARSGEIAEFYMTHSIESAKAFLYTYDVEYVILGRLEDLFYNQIRPCQLAPDGDLMYCDMSGRPMGMIQPEMRLEDCTPINPDDEDFGYVCSTHGSDKFDQLEEQGTISEVFSSGITKIYRVNR